MPVLAILPLELKHRPAIYRIFDEARRGMRYLPPLQPKESYPWVRDVLLKSAQLLVAEEKGIALGFLALDGEELTYLCVASDHRGRGIGGELLKTAQERSGGRLHLDVFDANRRAISFYERNGFRTIAHTEAGGNEEGLSSRRMEWRGAPASA